jgi:hypothetical protein
MFQFCVNSQESSWISAGIGIRLIQAAGYHRRRVTTSPLTIEEQSWKRLFWYQILHTFSFASIINFQNRFLVFADRTLSLILGRPNAIHEEE